MASYTRKWLDAPKSTNTVRVRLVDTTAVMLLHAISFIKPVMPDHKTMNMTDVAFLVENPRLGKKAMFDLGVRKDFWNLPPKIANRLGSIALGLRVDQDVPEILRDNGISLEDINDIIWSHGHWDHTGDPSIFPSTTTLVYGPSISQFRPGYPIDPNSPQLASNFSGRTNKEISFSSLKIGGFPAYDFYGDDSFYLLDTPGHAPGHMCGLARTSTDENGNSTFVLFGGDMCHFCGDLRPSTVNRLPTGDVPGCDQTGMELIRNHPQFPPLPSEPTEEDVWRRLTTPWYKVSTDKKSAYDGVGGPAGAQKTVDNVREKFDNTPNVFVALAHDTAMLSIVPTLNKEPEKDLNNWLTSGWKEQAFWGWLREPGQKENLVEGFWMDGVKYKTMDDLMKDIGRAESKI